MERRFDMSDFEQSLKDHADQFKMMPSKRVWNGIYNNLHPGSKWPSITVAIIFLITLVTIGNLNNAPSHPGSRSNNNLNSSNEIPNADNQEQNRTLYSEPSDNSMRLFKEEVNKVPNNTVQTKTAFQDKNTAADQLISGNNLPEKLEPSKTQSNIAANRVSINDNRSSHNKTINDLRLPNTGNNKSGFTANKPIIEISVLEEPAISQTNPQLTFAQEQPLYKNDLSIPVSYQIFSLPPSESLHSASVYLNNTEPVMDDQKLGENPNTTLGINKLHRKKNNRIEWTFYVNPTIGSVSINKKTIQPSGNASSIVVLSNQPSFKLVHNSRFGFETGAEMSLKMARKLRFISGFNLSYSGYNNVSNLVHPTFATLTLNDNKGGTYSKNYITHYGNGQSQDHIYLVNYNFEFSIPLGVQYTIWGNQKINIGITSLLEPSLVLKGNAYQISSDGRYYVNDPSLLRSTNLEGHFGSYITFIGKKIKWHLGPDFRYQFLSTYKNIYPTKEHLMDYGIRIGISK